MHESWKPIEGFEYYEVSNLGNVRSLDRTVSFINDNFSTFKGGCVLKYGLSGAGYCQVGLWKPDGTVYRRYLHRLVALHFIPNPQNKRTVNHKNGIKTDNRIENLEWCTQSENSKHAVSSGLMSKQQDKPKLNIKSAIEIRRWHALQVISKRKLAFIYGVSTSSINKIINHQTYKNY